MESGQEIKTIRRELELIISQLRHAVIYETDKDRIKLATDNLDKQVRRLAEIERKISEMDK